MLKVFQENRTDPHQLNAVFGYEDGIYYHNLILKAIKEKNGEKAREIMFEHLQNGINRLADQKGESQPGENDMRR